MLITIPDVLTGAQLEHARQVLSAAEWVDGRVTAGHQSAQAKDNMQMTIIVVLIIILVLLIIILK